MFTPKILIELNEKKINVKKRNEKKKIIHFHLPFGNNGEMQWNVLRICFKSLILLIQYGWFTLKNFFLILKLNRKKKKM